MVDEQEPSVQSEQCKSEVEEMYLPKPWNWSSISENTRVMLENPLEGTIYESSQIKEKHETTKLLNEEATIIDGSANSFMSLNRPLHAKLLILGRS